MEEADVEINGTPLSMGQVMAMRVACTEFRTRLENNKSLLGGDEHGRKMAEAYRKRLTEVIQLLIEE